MPQRQFMITYINDKQNQTYTKKYNHFNHANQKNMEDISQFVCFFGYLLLKAITHKHQQDYFYYLSNKNNL